MIINWLLFTLTSAIPIVLVGPVKMSFSLVSSSESFSLKSPSMIFKFKISE